MISDGRPRSARRRTLAPPGIVYLPFSDAPSATIDLSCIYRKDDQSPILQALLAAIQAFREQQGLQ